MTSGGLPDMRDEFRLMEYSHAGGCGCKLGPKELQIALAKLPILTHPNLVVGLATGDDAAVWRTSNGRLLIATVDFFTPIVNDPRTYGAIAATNAASDVYAMGGTPLFALNVAAWPRGKLPFEVLGDVLLGAAEAAERGGWIAVGGHTVDGAEPLFGQVVIGEIETGEAITNEGALPGDVLVLTKALGTGTVSTALKAGSVDDSVYAAAVASMTTLNADAARAARAAGAHAMTDVTGFGLVGHLHKMLMASGVAATLDVPSIPILPGVESLIADGLIPGGTKRNSDFVGDLLDEHPKLAILADPQSSGGLLFACEPGAAERAVESLRGLGHPATIIGHVHAGTAGRIHLQG